MKIRDFFTLTIPKEIVMEITDNCNLDCPFCFNKMYINGRAENDKSELTIEKSKIIIDSIARSKVRQIRFSGGEPLLKKDIFVLMEYAKSKGLRVWLNTNATLVDKEKAGILGELVDNVLVPLNAFDSISEYSATNKQLFRKKLKGIKLLKHSSVKVIRCGTVATRYNIENLERIHNLVERLDIDDWELFRPVPIQPNLLPIDNNDMAMLVEKLLRINHETKKTYKIYNALPFCCYEPEKVARVASGAQYDDGHTRFIIAKDGIAKPVYYLSENIGNTLDDGVEKIWNKSFMKDMRELRYAPPICRGCIYISVCKGGSRLASKMVGGDYRAPDYLAQPHRYSSLFFKKQEHSCANLFGNER